MKPIAAFSTLALAAALLVHVLAAESPRSAPAHSSVRLLIVGGGSSHDFARWFEQEDLRILRSNDLAQCDYTDKPGGILSKLGAVDVLYLSNNQPLPDPALRQAIFSHVEAGKGLLLVHPALWYNWQDWPEYNRRLAGGGAKSHDRFGEFEVTVTQPAHPLMHGLPASFRITDELYHFVPDATGSPIQVLATGRNLTTGKTYPIVWTTAAAKGRIACITLGHDGQAHEHPAFRQLLRNSARWVAGR